MNLIKHLQFSSLILFVLFNFNNQIFAQSQVNPNTKAQTATNKVNTPSRCNEIVQHQTTTANSTSGLTIGKYSNPNISQFTQNNTKWKLKSIDIDNVIINANRPQYNSLLTEVKSDLTGNIEYYESSDYALLASSSNQIHPIYYGKIQMNSNDLILSHRVENCPNCSKNISYSRTYNPDQTMILRLQDEDDDKSDVIYILTFEK
jgi:hypothetical protein